MSNRANIIAACCAVGVVSIGSLGSLVPHSGRADAAPALTDAAATGLSKPIRIAGTDEVRVGAVAGPQDLHPITRPGLYGVGRAPQGNKYGVIDGKLVRYDPQTMQILAVIRAVDAILD